MLVYLQREQGNGDDHEKPRTSWKSGDGSDEMELCVSVWVTCDVRMYSLYSFKHVSVTKSQVSYKFQTSFSFFFTSNNHVSFFFTSNNHASNKFVSHVSFFSPNNHGWDKFVSHIFSRLFLLDHKASFSLWLSIYGISLDVMKTTTEFVMFLSNYSRLLY